MNNEYFNVFFKRYLKTTNFSLYLQSLHFTFIAQQSTEGKIEIVLIANAS